MEKECKITAIVVLYNPDLSRLAYIRDILLPQVSNIVYIDNSTFPSLKDYSIGGNEFIINNRTNFGIAKAQNQGITKAIELNSTHVLLLDQDSLPDINMVENLKNFLLNNSSLACVGPRIINRFNMAAPSYGVRIKGMSLEKIPVSDKPLNVSYCIASGSLIPIEILKKVGLMKEEMFIDGVDLEWGLRAKSMGYYINIVPKATLVHELGNGHHNRILSHSPIREYYIVRNNILLLKYNHIPLGYKLRKVFLTLGRITKSYWLKDREYTQQALKGFKDGIKGLFHC